MAPSAKKTAKTRPAKSRAAKTRAAKTRAQARGDQGEHRVADWYRRAGYEIVARNWRCFEGEIDIIARRGKTIAICEVKARRSTCIDPALSINRAKQARLRTAAFRWLQENPQKGNLRFDAAFVVGSEIQVIEGAF